jgi:hypothetical protein
MISKIILQIYAHIKTTALHEASQAEMQLSVSNEVQCQYCWKPIPCLFPETVSYLQRKRSCKEESGEIPSVVQK